MTTSQNRWVNFIRDFFACCYLLCIFGVAVGFLVAGAAIADELMNGEDMSWGAFSPIEATIHVCKQPSFFGLIEGGTREECAASGMQACLEHYSWEPERCPQKVASAMHDEYPHDAHN